MNAQKIIFSIILITLILFCLTIRAIYISLPSNSEILNIKIQKPIKIYSQDNILLGEIGSERCYPVPYEEIPQRIIDAFIAIEDTRFFEHFGVDFKALLRAFIADCKAGKKIQGGSTITMQLARNFFLNQDKTYLRKLKEILLSYKLEASFSKKKILELYLNKVFLGHHSYGILAASQLYFGKNLIDLSLNECAVLAGLPKAPSILNPLSAKNRCRQRRDAVLLKMLEQKRINEQDYKIALHQSIEASYHKKVVGVAAPCVVDYIASLLHSKEKNFIHEDNQDIWTTIDSSLQKAAQESLDNGLINYTKQEIVSSVDIININDQETALKNLRNFYSSTRLIPAVLISKEPNQINFLLKIGEVIEKDHLSENLSLIEFKEKYKNFPLGSVLYYDTLLKKILMLPVINGAVITLDQEGAIKVMVGSTSYSQSHFNRATQTKRPIGSTIKSLIYAQAIDQGFNLNSDLQDSAYSSLDEKGFFWRPQNFDKNYMGTVSLKTAFLKSANLATISLAKDLQLDKLWSCLAILTLSPIEQNPSLYLGSLDLSPLQLASIYTAFVNEGVFNAHPFITEKQRNLALFKKLCSPQAAYLITHLQKNVLSKTNPVLAERAGGKTGTTNKQLDLWFAGFHHDLTTVVWIGYDQPRSTGRYASQVALPIWTGLATNDIEESRKERDVPENIFFKRQGTDLVPFWDKKAH